MTNTTEDADDINFFKYFSHLRFGSCSVAKDDNLILTVGNKELDATNITDDDVQWLEQKLDFADSNGKDVTAKDTLAHAQHARYTKAFLLNFDVNEILGKMEINGFSKPYKMILYKSGSVIAKQFNFEHPDLEGTLVLTLPTEYTGGELCFDDFNVDVHQKQHDKCNKKTLRFLYFDTEIEHSTSEVISGYRIILVYNIFSDKASAGMCKPIVKLSNVPKEWLNELLKYAHDFCKKKKNILLGSFTYRLDVYNKVLAYLKKHLKVIDVAADAEDTELEKEQIREIHEVEYDNDNPRCDEEISFDDHVVDTHKVEHILFSSQTELTEDKIKYTAPYDSPHADGDFPILKGYLINPKK